MTRGVSPDARDRTGSTQAIPGKDAGPDVPLVVDLDGTLVKSDLLMEGIVRLLRRNPLYAFLLPLWMLKGKASFKSEIAGRIALDARLLPYHEALLGYLHEQHARGRLLVLATGSDERNAAAVASHLGLFSEVLASDGSRNLAGRGKAEALLGRFGEGGFDYAANDSVDLAIWEHARYAILIDPAGALESRARRVADIQHVMTERRRGLGTIVRTLRVHQWVKNALVFVPIVAAHEWNEPRALAQCALAFCAFSAAASALYLVNDSVDLDADRAHPRKRKRPLAAGDVSLVSAAGLATVLLLIAVAVAALVSHRFLAVLAAYLVVNAAYSWWLKTRVLFDAMCLAGLYTLRVIGGAVAASLVLSFWLLAFSMFVFVSLALIKRCAELRALADSGGIAARGRDYRIEDIGQLTGLGTGTGVGAAVILALYIHSEDVVRIYTRPEVLWLLCPLLLYWIGRMWIKCGRGEMHDDPIVFAARDRVSWIVLSACGLLILLAS